MRTTQWVVLAALASFCIPSIEAQENKDSRTLTVRINYTGAGKVDAQHKIFVFLFDSPDFVQTADVNPVASDSTTAKDGTCTFHVDKSPVYVVAVYDPQGAYEGMSPPPSGSSFGLYGKDGRPEPVKIDAGKTVKVEVAFDDSTKMP